MCVAPGLLPTGELVGCRKCWQCKEVRVNDWLGRNIAESKTALSCNFVTLTYGEDMTYGGEDHVRSTVLTYSDVQKWFKKLRKAGHSFRYFAIGEYGSLKARAHWHVLMYWLSKPPKFKLNVREVDDFWEHGFSRWEDIRDGVGAVRYACKYITKDIGDAEKQGHIAMSKRPPLGTDYVLELAQQYVDQGIAPQDLKYGWRDVKNANGEKLRFMLKGKVAEYYALAFERKWKERYGALSHAPYSQALQDILDRIVRRSDDGSWELYKAGMPWLRPPDDASEPKLHVMFQKWYVVADGMRYFWSYDEHGNHAWVPEATNHEL